MLLVVASNLFTLALVFGLRAYDEHYRFDVAKWHAESAGDCDDDHRRQMVEDLDANYLRIGMTEASVRFLLGQPTYKESPRVWSYDTGLIVSDCFHLVVVFDEPGGQLVEWSHPFLDNP